MAALPASELPTCSVSFRYRRKRSRLTPSRFGATKSPFIFLNNFKTAEYGLMDAAHELGHVCCHRRAGAHAGTPSSRTAEREANQFASAFLMPGNDVRPRMPSLITVPFILKAKLRWRVSAMRLSQTRHLNGRPYSGVRSSSCVFRSRSGTVRRLSRATAADGSTTRPGSRPAGPH
jgi:Zn-dependent peptidase ImmA (M78 family)